LKRFDLLVILETQPCLNRCVDRSAWLSQPFFSGGSSNEIETIVQMGLLRHDVLRSSNGSRRIQSIGSGLGSGDGATLKGTLLVRMALGVTT